MRLFVAICFSSGLKREIGEYMRRLREAGVTGDYTREENLHLTLAFIGETQRLAAAKECLAGLEAGQLTLFTEGTGRFGDTLWIGLRRNAELETLAAQTQDALRAAGFDIDRRAFKPHVTLVRRSEGVHESIAPPQAEMRVEKVSLMRSERIGGKLVYTELYGKSLGGYKK